VPQFNDPQVQKFLSDPQVTHFLHLLYSPAILLTNDLFTLTMSILVLVGALRMKALRSYEFSMIAALLALLPCVTSCCLIGLPFGIWAIIVLRRLGIKGQFK
jgi:ABC-type proline/glycine betaine transport system permease subunit